MSVRVVMGLIVIWSFFLFGCAEEERGYVSAAVNGNLVNLVVSNDKGINSRNNYVSAAALSENKFLISNYVYLLILDRDSGEICKVSAENAAGERVQAEVLADGQRFKSGVAYNPTGVYVAEDGKIFVANYKANNILFGSLDVDGCRFVIEGQFYSSNTYGPENVVVDAVAGLMISANYDAGTVVAFDLESRQEKWSASVPQAHGVTVSKGKVYATGLTERKIYEINIDTGNIVRSKGALGWSPMDGQYMWPTSIFALKDGDLVVSDAQSGFVSILDSSTLDVIRYTGGNGPAENLFNYPYSAIPVGDELMVLSSMRGQILFVNPNNMVVGQKFSFADEKWPVVDSKKMNYEPVFGVAWKGYIDMSGFTVRIDEEHYRLGFGNLNPQKQAPVFQIPNSGGLFNTNSYMYFLQGYTGGNVDLIFSSSSTTLLGVAHKPGFPDVLVPKLIALDSWKVGSQLVSGGGGGASLIGISSEVEKIAQGYYKELEANRWVNKKSIYSLLQFSNMGLDYGQFLIRLDKAFGSASGREFKFVYDQCAETVCDVLSLKAAAYSYFRNTSVLPYVSLEEYLLVGMISGISPQMFFDVDFEYEGCEGASYYQGYGVEALQTEALNDYLSAIDLAGSSLCLKMKGNVSVRGIDVVWNDAETVPKSLEIYGRDERVNDGWEKLGEFSNFNPSLIEGYARSQFLFDNKKNFSKLFIKITNGGAQNRMILREVKPVLDLTYKSIIDPSRPFAFVNCPMVEAYPGHGTEVFETNALNDYFSAQSIESSSVCFSNNTRRSLVGLELGWYSSDEVGELVQVFGSFNNDFTKEISLGKYSVGSPLSLSGYHFSSFSVSAEAKYPFYRVSLLKGKGQGRFILRSFTPRYSSDGSGGSASLRKIAQSVSNSLHYGVGVSKALSKTKYTLDSLEELIMSSDSAHCGDFSLVFVNKLPDEAVWKVYDLKAYDDRVHTVVEVVLNDQTYVYDPTLGVEYRCSLESMISGSCKYSADPSFHQVNPVLQVFRGVGFFYGASVENVYASSSDLISPYF